MSRVQKRKCENLDVTTIKTSSEPHLHWKKKFDINPLIFRMNAVFEADKEKDDFCISNKTTTFF